MTDDNQDRTPPATPESEGRDGARDGGPAMDVATSAAVDRARELLPANPEKRDIAEALRQAQIEAREKLKRPTILVCGYTGCGKTSLIQSICGSEVVDDDKIVHGRPGTMDYLNYSSDLINFWDSQGFEPGETEEEFLSRSREFFRARQRDPDVDNHIHLVWYCIQGSGARVTRADLDLIKNIFANVIVVITKSDITKPRQMEAIMGVLGREGIRSGRVVPVADTDLQARMRLVELSHDLLPEAYRDAFVAAQLIDLSGKQAKAQAIIHAASAAAAGVGATPIPIADAALLSPIQLGMIASLASLYGASSQATKGVLVTMAAEAVGVATASSLVKAFPGIGNLIQGGVAASLTEAIGQVANRYLIEVFRARATGTSIPDFEFDIEQFRDLVNLRRVKLR